MTGKLDGLTDRMRARMTEARLGNLDRDNVRLPRRGRGAAIRAGPRAQRARGAARLAAREAEDREGSWEALDAARRRDRRRGVRAGGARAGRERYDEILAWARSLRDRAQDRGGDAAGEMADRAHAAATETRTKAEVIGEGRETVRRAPGRRSRGAPGRPAIAST